MSISVRRFVAGIGVSPNTIDGLSPSMRTLYPIAAAASQEGFAAA